MVCVCGFLRIFAFVHTLAAKNAQKPYAQLRSRVLRDA